LNSFVCNAPLGTVDPYGKNAFINALVGIVGFYIVAEQIAYWVQIHATLNLQQTTLETKVRTAILTGSSCSGTFPAKYIRFGPRLPFGALIEHEYDTDVEYEPECVNGIKKIKIQYKRDDGVIEKSYIPNPDPYLCP